MKRTRLVGLSAAVTVALITALLYGLPASGQSQNPVEPESARGYAYGASALGGQEPQLDPLPEREAVAPPPEPQEQVKRVSKQDTGADVIVVGDLLYIEADACLDAGASANLQFEINRARILERGDTVDRGDTPENEGPNDPDPQRQLVRYPEGFPETARCLVPVTSDAPIQGPTTSPSPTPTSTPTAAPSPSPTQAPPPNCEDVVTDPEDEDFSPVCFATTPLWNGHGYARAADTFLGEDIEAEAVARCTPDGKLRVATGAAFGLTGVLASSTQRPNQRLDAIVAGSSSVTYWETNWDPATNTTTDGSDTVWVNGLHIITSTGRDIILSRAEATADCPGEPEPTPTATATETEPPPDIPAACQPSPGNQPSGEIIIGTQGPDAIAGTPRDDIICTLAGDDLVDALAGKDLVILGSGDDEAEGGPDKDTIHGDEGDDSMNGGLMHDLLIGGPGMDQMKGNRGNDTLRGNRGHDTLQGGNGADLLRGGRGNDSLKGFNGNDILNGDAGFDQCVGGRGNDRIKNCER